MMRRTELHEFQANRATSPPWRLQTMSCGWRRRSRGGTSPLSLAITHRLVSRPFTGSTSTARKGCGAAVRKALSRLPSVKNDGKGDCNGSRNQNQSSNRVLTTPKRMVAGLRSLSPGLSFGNMDLLARREVGPCSQGSLIVLASTPVRIAEDLGLHQIDDCRLLAERLLQLHSLSVTVQ